MCLQIVVGHHLGRRGNIRVCKEYGQERELLLRACSRYASIKCKRQYRRLSSETDPAWTADSGFVKSLLVPPQSRQKLGLKFFVPVTRICVHQSEKDAGVGVLGGEDPGRQSVSFCIHVVTLEYITAAFLACPFRRSRLDSPR
jgi:hypothetical protein